MVRSFELERPRTKPHFPKWDLTLVFSVLVSPPFEPLQFCDFKELTLKTVFLLALASGRRCSEIYALSYSKKTKQKGKRKVQEMPQSQTAAFPRHQKEEETDKSKQAQIEQTCVCSICACLDLSRF